MSATIGSSIAGAYETDADKGWKVDTVSVGSDSDIADGQFQVNCTITKEFTKLERDYGVFMEYAGTAGALKFDGSASADWGKKDIKFKLEEPTYDFGDVEDDSFIVQAMDSNESEIFAEDIDSSAEGFGSFKTKVDYMLSPYFYADDKLRTEMTLDIPSKLLPDGAIVFQYVQLTPENDPGSTYVGITCSVEVGKEGSQVVSEFSGTTRLDSTTMKGKKVFEQNTAEIEAESDFGYNKDITKYNAFTSEIRGNKVQPCIAEMPIFKKNPDEGLYTTWRGIGGARIYKNADDTTPLEIPESEMSFVITKPDYT